MPRALLECFLVSEFLMGKSCVDLRWSVDCRQELLQLVWKLRGTSGGLWNSWQVSWWMHVAGWVFNILSFPQIMLKHSCSFTLRGCNQSHQRTCIYCQNNEAGIHKSHISTQTQTPVWNTVAACRLNITPKISRAACGRRPSDSWNMTIVFDTQVHDAYESVKPIHHFQYPVFNFKETNLLP